LPISGDTLGGTRDRIRTNFQLIESIQSINHVAYGTLGQGKHKFLQMPEQGSAPTTLVNEGGLYTKVGTSPAETNLFFRGESSNYEYQLTHVDSTLTASFSTSTGVNDSGWTFLPGGLLMQYGLRSVAAKGTATTITFPKLFATAVYSITIGSVTGEGNSPGENNQFVKDGSVLLNQFQIVNIPAEGEHLEPSAKVYSPVLLSNKALKPQYWSKNLF